MEERTNHIGLEAYQNLMAGTNIVALQAVVDDIRDGVVYIVDHDGSERRLAVDENDNLVFEDELNEDEDLSDEE